MKKLLAKAKALYKKDRYKDALVIAKKVLALDKNNSEALFYVAHGLYRFRQFKTSLQFWKRLERICPTEPSLYLNMGACYDDLGNKRLAIQNYKKELALNPASATVLHNLGDIYFFAHKYKLAANYLERSHSQEPLPDNCIGKLARSYFKTGQPEKEQILYEEFLQKTPNDVWALNNLGLHLMGQREYHRALLRLKKAAQLDPSDKIVAKNISKAEREIKKIRALSR